MPITKNKNSFLTVAALLSCSKLLACGDEGSAPSIRDLHFAPNVIAVQELSAITASFVVEDPDGDANTFYVKLTGPDGATQTQGPHDIAEALKEAYVDVNFQMALLSPSAGEISFEIWATDEAEHESNRLIGTLQANQ